MTGRDEHDDEARTEPLDPLMTDPVPEEATAPADEAGAVPEEATAPADEAGAADPRPRIRFAGIAWGVVLATAALVLLGVVTDPARRAAAADWLGTLQGDTVAIILALVLGAVLVLGALLATVRRLQRSRADA